MSSMLEEDVLRERSNANVTMIYGVATLSAAIINLLVYLLANNYYYIAISSEYFLSHMIAFFPVALAWLMTLIFDGTLMRKIFQVLVSISLMGPFGGHWFGTIMFILAGDDAGTKANSNGVSTAYDEGMFWVTLLVQLTFTIGEMIA